MEDFHDSNRLARGAPASSGNAENLLKDRIVDFSLLTHFVEIGKTSGQPCPVVAFGYHRRPIPFREQQHTAFNSLALPNQSGCIEVDTIFRPDPMISTTALSNGAREESSLHYSIFNSACVMGHGLAFGRFHLRSSLECRLGRPTDCSTDGMDLSGQRCHQGLCSSLPHGAVGDGAVGDG